MRSGEAQDALTVNARVLAALPNSLFKVELLAQKRGQATVHAAGSAALVRLLPGDEVVVELLPYDPTRGRIVRRTEQRRS
jgi:translation initiation factor IF-1